MRDAILAAVAPAGAFEEETGFITSVRHEQLLRESASYLEQAAGAVDVVPLSAVHGMVVHTEGDLILLKLPSNLGEGNAAPTPFRRNVAGMAMSPTPVAQGEETLHLVVSVSWAIKQAP